MSVSIRGYSERGLLNSLLYEIRYSIEGLNRLKEVLSLSRFPNVEPGPNWDNFTTAEVIVEQSFSSFGDLDALILLDGSMRQSIFIEAKVKVAQRSKWSISDEWGIFQQHLSRSEENKRKSSNLFVQLYRKQNLVRDICGTRRIGEVDSVAKTWTIGKNPVVKRAVEQLRDYCMDGSPSWFLALVPDSAENLAAFFRTKLRDFTHTELPAWQNQQVHRIGYLPWHDVRTLCRTNEKDWCDTLRCFDFNRELFDQARSDLAASAVAVPFPVRSQVIYTDEQGVELEATVVRSRRDNTRIKLSDGRTPLVPTGRLRVSLRP